MIVERRIEVETSKGTLYSPGIVGPYNASSSLLGGQGRSPGLIDELVRIFGQFGQILPDVVST